MEYNWRGWRNVVRPHGVESNYHTIYVLWGILVVNRGFSRARLHPLTLRAYKACSDASIIQRCSHEIHGQHALNARPMLWCVGPPHVQRSSRSSGPVVGVGRRCLLSVLTAQTRYLRMHARLEIVIYLVEFLYNFKKAMWSYPCLVGVSSSNNKYSERLW